MLVINYNGNKPITDYYKFSVQGNNLADKIRFLISLNQSGLVFDENYHYYAKVQCVDDDFYDKVELSEIVFDDVKNLLLLDFVLESKHTCHKSIEISVSCENLNDEIVWQTQIVKVAIPNGVYADEEVAGQFPTILQDLQRQIDELKQQGGGGGGASDVQIEKVWLSYTPNKDYIALNYAFLPNDDNEIIYNDPRDIFVNIKTSPINDTMEQAIKDDKFVIRFDYPIKQKRNLKWDGEDEQFRLIRPKDKMKHLTHISGNGYRSFTNSLWYWDKHDNQFKRKVLADFLINSLYFVEESDIKVNDNNEKYLFIKISLSDLVAKLYRFESGYEIDFDLFSAESNYSDFSREYIGGLPNTEIGSQLDNKMQHFSSVFPIGKMGFNRSQQVNAPRKTPHNIKHDPLFNSYGVFPITSSVDELLDGETYTIVDSKFKYGGQRTFKHCAYQSSATGLGYFKIVSSRNNPVIACKKSSIVAVKPRCCILKDDYATNTDNMWKKKYSQCDQNIRVVNRSGIFQIGSSYCFMPFRINITRKV